MPALARPDLDVRREMVRLELDARLAALQAEVRMLESEGDVVPLQGAPPATTTAAAEEPTEPPADSGPA
jgi:hypothetical protein